MEKRTSAFARIFALIALVGAVLLIVVVVSASLGGIRLRHEVAGH